MSEAARDHDWRLAFARAVGWDSGLSAPMRPEAVEDCLKKIAERVRIQALRDTADRERLLNAQLGALLAAAERAISECGIPEGTCGDAIHELSEEISKIRRVR